MQLKIPYGKKQIVLKIPPKNMAAVISSDDDLSGADEDLIINKALDNPIGSQRLSEIARGRGSANIMISDITRPSPSYKFLPAILEELKRGGMKYRDIRIISGLGIHREQTSDEHKKLVGEQVYKSIEVIDSNPDDCMSVGRTSRGTPVEVFRKIIESEILIATGNIEYHYFAGFSGGAKALMPGMCNRNTIQANHSMMLEEKAVAGNFFDNPIRQDIEEAGRMVGIDYIFNVILDDDKNIIDAVAGKNNESFIQGIKKYDDIYKKEIAVKGDIVITSAGGFPKDINLYQSQKALDNVKNIVSENGMIILVAKCQEGFGEDTFEEWMKNCSDYSFLYKNIKKNFILGGHKAVAISSVLDRTPVYLYSDFNRDKAEGMGFRTISDLQDFIDSEVARKPDTNIVVVPTGRLVKFNKDIDKNNNRDQE